MVVGGSGRVLLADGAATSWPLSGEWPRWLAGATGLTCWRYRNVSDDLPCPPGPGPIRPTNRHCRERMIPEHHECRTEQE